MKRIIAFITTSLILLACAQVVPLSGGKKDVEPPKELKSFPSNKSVNFLEKNITIEFNEFIRLQNLSSQLIVSPLMDEPPEISVRGKKLIIKIKSELAQNTTYSINFGDAIRDITESNAIPNYKYVFSTGSYIDSLNFSGHVVDAFNLKAQNKIYVLLYDSFEDSIPLKSLPKYVAITNPKGEFSITNIAEGSYKLFALKDINSNYLYDLPNEQIAFKNDSIKINTSLNEQLIYLFKEDNELQYLKKAENKTFGKIDFLLNLPTTKLNVSSNINKDNDWFIEEKNAKGDSLTLWVLDKNILKNQKEIEFIIADSNKVIDTTTIKLIPPKDFKDTSLTLFSNIKPIFELNKNINLFFKRPIKNYYVDSIKLYEDSSLVSFKLVQNKNLRNFTIQYQFKENTSYKLSIPPNSFIDIYDLNNDTITQKFTTKKQANYGTIFLTINPFFPDPYIVQLYKGKTLIKESYFQSHQKVNFNYLSVGNYQIKLIVDKNNNKKWDTGNYLKHKQPEKVIFYKNPIKIRANWDNKIIWNLKTNPN